jgi:hypothetical protein
LHLDSVNENKEATKRTSLRSKTMAKEIKSVIVRSSDTIIADAFGMAALIVMLFAALSLPNLF